MNRRRFLQTLAAASTTPMWVRFAEQAAYGAAGDGVVRTRGGGQLLVVLLEGGNDHLNTVVPYLDRAYRQMRPGLALSEGEVLRMGNGFGLHPSLPTFAQYWNAGRLAIVQQVGNPRNDFSHFASLEAWETGSPDKRFVDGWLGRYLDQTTSAATGPVRAVALTDIMPTTLQSNGTSALSLDSIIDFAFRDDDAPDAQLRHGTYIGYAEQSAPDGSARAAVLQGQRELIKALDPVKQTRSRYNTAGKVPTAAETVAQMFAAGVGTEIGFVTLGEFDTHSAQLRQHASRLAELDSVVKSFFTAAGKLGVADKSAVLVISEFGRRVPQNSGYGTDHGDGGAAFVLGPRVKGGLYGPRLDLSRLRDGNLPVRVDLRSVYATVLEQWLNVNHTAILGGRFTTLPLFA